MLKSIEKMYPLRLIIVSPKENVLISRLWLWFTNIA